MSSLQAIPHQITTAPVHRSIGPPQRSATAIWVDIALWLSYTGLFGRAFGTTSPIIHHGGRFLFDICAVILILTSLPSLLMAPRRRESHYNLVLLFLGVCTMAGVVGLVYKNSLVLWTLLGFLPFMSASASLLGSTEDLFECLLRTLIRQVSIGTIFAAGVLLLARPANRLEWTGEYGDGMAKIACRTMYAVPFLLPYMGRLPLGANAVVALAWVELLALNIIGANRGALVCLLLVMPAVLLVVGLVHRDGLIALRRLVKALVMVGFCVGPAINVAVAHDPTIGDYAVARFDDTLARLSRTTEDDDLMTTSQGFIEVSSDEFLGEESRGGELRDFLQQLEPADYLCGRGFGGGWLSKYWGTNWYMVHVGPAHMILVGGLPLLGVFLMVICGAISAAWRALKTHPAAPGALCYLLVFTMGVIQHGAIQDEIEVAVFWITTGLAFAAAAPGFAWRHPGAKRDAANNLSC